MSFKESGGMPGPDEELSGEPTEINADGVGQPEIQSQPEAPAAEQPAKVEAAAESLKPWTVIHAGLVYGAGSEVQRDVDILINPGGTIEEIVPRDQGAQMIDGKKKADSAFKVVEENSEVVMPGMTDAHNHPIYFSELRAMEPAFIFGIRTERDLVKSLKAQLEGKSGKQFVLGWDTSSLPNVSRETLDEVRTEPFVIVDTSFHGAVANTAALKEIDDYLEKSNLKGTLRGHANPDGKLYEEYALIWAEVMEREIDPSKVTAGIDDYLEEMRIGGSLFTHDMIISTPLQLDIWRQLSGKSREAITVGHISPVMLRRAIAQGTDVSDLNLKLLADGSLTSRSALFYEPYLGTDNKGIKYHSQEDARAALELAASQGINNVSVHAIGDRGIDQAILMRDVWAEVMERHGLEGGQARIEHMSVPRADSIEAAAKRGIIACPQPNFLIDMVPFADRLDKDRLRNMVPLRRMLDAGLRSGLRTMFGTDGMPNSMLLALSCAIDSPNGAQRIGLSEAVNASSAVAADYEGRKGGRIAKGEPANLLLTKRSMLGDLVGTGLLESTPETFQEMTAELEKRLASGVEATMRNGVITRNKVEEE